VRPCLDPEVTLPPGSSVYFQPRRLKRDLSPPSFCVKYEAREGNPVHALANYLQTCREFGSPIHDILARVAAPNHRSFFEKPMGSSQLTLRLRRYFSAVGIGYHVTTHGVRRGAIQAPTRAGAGSEDVGERAQIRTPSVRVCYQDERRHLPCLLRKFGKPVR
jgi:hypothetical protein